MAIYKNISSKVVTLTDLFNTRTRKDDGKSQEATILPGESLTVNDSVAVASSDIALFVAEGLLLIIEAVANQFYKTGNGDEVGLVLTQVDGTKRILYFENDEYADDVFTS